MKKDQILDMIGEAPDHYVKDAKEHTKKRRFPRWSKWMGGIAAVLALVLLANNMPGIPLMISAKAISHAAEPRVRTYREVPDDEKKAWWAENDLRDERLDAALPALGEFAERCSAEIITGADITNRVWSPVNAYIALAMTAELTEGETQQELLSVLGVDSLEDLRSRISAVWESAYADDSHEISILANSLWLDNDLEYTRKTMDILAHDYYASVYQGDLGSERTNRDITNWMKNQTGGLLKDRTGTVNLPEEDQMLVMASTVYFQSKWSKEFQMANNTQDIFHAVTGDVEVTFMNKKECEMYY
ncbi:MAG: hypothetical protein IKL84_09185, partial [Clostridia bacterium]|nr:hypothetical protein [Clostridia bacterium]